MAHNKILTGDNISKRKIAGPHRCALCRCNLETTQHLFLDCLFAKEVWDITRLDFQISFASQTSVVALFASWNSIYPQSIPPKSFWRKVWIALPKFVCWQLWLARNQQIFKEIQQTPIQVAAKAKSLLMEAAQQKYFKEDPLLTPVEKRWLSLEPHPQKYLLTPQEANSDWRIREPDDSFQIWWKS